MSIDTSVRNPSEGPRRVADALLRATGGTAAMLLMPPALADSTDAGQLGINSPNFQQLPLAPVQFRKLRVNMLEGQLPKYELAISASAVEQQVSEFQLTSADALFTLAGGVIVAGGNFCIESWSVSEALGQAYTYRLLLHAAEPHSLATED